MAPPQITIYRAGQYTLAMPPVDELEQTFATSRHVAEDDARHGVKITRQPQPLAWPHDWHGTPAMETFVGYEPRITTILENAGYEVRLTGTTCPR